MKIREVLTSDVLDLQELYLNHLKSKPSLEPPSIENWVSLIDSFIKDEDYHLLVGEVEGKVVSTITLIVIRNLTNNLRPYALIENVVTHSAHRNKGYSSALIDFGAKLSKKENCYKIMLMTSSKKESTLNFYRKNGFDINEKTAFIMRL